MLECVRKCSKCYIGTVGCRRMFITAFSANSERQPKSNRMFRVGSGSEMKDSQLSTLRDDNYYKCCCGSHVHVSWIRLASFPGSIS